MTTPTTILVGDMTVTAGPVLAVLLAAIPDLARDIQAMANGETITRDLDGLKVEFVRGVLMPLQGVVTVSDEVSIDVDCHGGCTHESISMLTERQSVAHDLQDALEARMDADEPIGDAFALPVSLGVVADLMMDDVDYTPPMSGDGLHMVTASW